MASITFTDDELMLMRHVTVNRINNSPVFRYQMICGKVIKCMTRKPTQRQIQLFALDNVCEMNLGE